MGVAGEAGMRTLCSQDCFMLSWADGAVFGVPEKAGVLSMSWSSWLFNFTVQALWNFQVPLGPDKIQILFKVVPSQLP